MFYVLYNIINAITTETTKTSAWLLGRRRRHASVRADTRVIRRRPPPTSRTEDARRDVTAGNAKPPDNVRQRPNSRTTHPGFFRLPVKYTFSLLFFLPISLWFTLAPTRAPARTRATHISILCSISQKKIQSMYIWHFLLALSWVSMHACCWHPKYASRSSKLKTQKSNYWVTLWWSTVSDIKITLRICLVSVSINWIYCRDEIVVFVRNCR